MSRRSKIYSVPADPPPECKPFLEKFLDMRRYYLEFASMPYVNDESLAIRKSYMDKAYKLLKDCIAIETSSKQAEERSN